MTAKLTASVAVDTVQVLADAEAIDRQVSGLPERLRSAPQLSTDRAKAFVAEVEADRETASAVFASVPGLEGLDLVGAIRQVYGDLDAAAFQLLDQVRFTLRTLREADSYGDTSEVAAVARYAGKQAEFRMRGGVMAPSFYQAGAALHRDATTGEHGAAQALFTDWEREVLRAFEWPDAR